MALPDMPTEIVLHIRMLAIEKSMRLSQVFHKSVGVEPASVAKGLG